MSVAKDWTQFKEWVDRRYPSYGKTMRLPFPDFARLVASAQTLDEAANQLQAVLWDDE